MFKCEVENAGDCTAEQGHPEEDVGDVLSVQTRRVVHCDADDIEQGTRDQDKHREEEVPVDGLPGVVRRFPVPVVILGVRTGGVEESIRMRVGDVLMMK